ncbi:MAG: hypothetical protein H7141_03450 [Burkholderiales bacterium]|nr:hypothetical protein [Bacteroidia bacterium]
MEKEVEKISLSKCKTVLESDGSKYTNEEVLEIREFLYMLAELDYQVYLKQRQRELEFENEKQKTEEENFKQAA